MENNDTIFSDIKPAQVEVTLFQGLLTRLIDFAIDIFILYFIHLLMPRDLYLYLVRLSALIVPGIVILVVTVYRFLFLMLFSKTIGMMICSVKLLNKEFQPLSTKEKFLSIFRSRFSTIKYYKDK